MGVLGYAALGVAAILIVFVPRIGVVARLRAGLHERRRRQEEDALKHLLERRNEGMSTAGATLGGLLRISSRARIRLQARLEEEGVIRTHGDEILLTAHGEELALHILRAHRLWEHYLATEAQMPLEKVHRAAHRLEHLTDAEQVGIMEARLGYPDTDPHGDPIPSRDGSVPDGEAVPLTEWTRGRVGVVVHLEDEPEVALHQVLAEGIGLGQRLRILEADAQRVTLTDGEREFRLAPAIAANVFVAEPTDAPILDGVGLDTVPDREPVEVVGINEACQGLTRRRLLDLGLIPGTRIIPELSNAFGDPRAYRIRGTLIALRREQSSQILVQPAADDHDTAPKERSTHAQPV